MLIPLDLLTWPVEFYLTPPDTLFGLVGSLGALRTNSQFRNQEHIRKMGRFGCAIANVRYRIRHLFFVFSLFVLFFFKEVIRFFPLLFSLCCFNQCWFTLTLLPFLDGPRGLMIRLSYLEQLLNSSLSVFSSSFLTLRLACWQVLHYHVTLRKSISSSTIGL